MNKAEFSRLYAAWLTKMEKKYAPKLYKALMAQSEAFVAALRNHDIRGARREAESEIINRGILIILSRIQREAGVFMARKWYRELRKEVRKYSGIGLNEKWIADILAYFREHNLMLVSSITETERNKLLALLEQGLQDGLSIPEIATMISETMPTFNRNRSFVIARTELTRGANAGTQIGAKELDFETQKEWLTSEDHRVRGQMPKDKFSHVALDGDKVGIDEKFNNGEWLEFPGDPNASPGNTVNCRCTILIVPKRDENGRLIPRTGVSIILPGQNTRRQIITI